MKNISKLSLLAYFIFCFLLMVNISSSHASFFGGQVFEGIVGNPFGSDAATLNPTNSPINLGSMIPIDDHAFWEFKVGFGGASMDIWVERKVSWLETFFSIHPGTAKKRDDLSVTRLFNAYNNIPVSGSRRGDPGVFNIFLPEGGYTIELLMFQQRLGGNYEIFIGTPGSAPDGNPNPTVPIPSALLLFGSGIFSLLVFYLKSTL